MDKLLSDQYNVILTQLDHLETAPLTLTVAGIILKAIITIVTLQFLVLHEM